MRNFLKKLIFSFGIIFCFINRDLDLAVKKQVLSKQKNEFLAGISDDNLDIDHDAGYRKFVVYPSYINPLFKTMSIEKFLLQHYGKLAAVSGSIHDRILGIFFASAYGDAMGASLKLSSRNAFEDIREMISNNSMNILPGEWLSSSSMACCLAHAIIAEQGKPSVWGIAHKFYSWVYGQLYSCDGLNIDMGQKGAKAVSVKDVSVGMKNAVTEFDLLLSQYNLDQYPSDGLNACFFTTDALRRMAPIPMAVSNSRKAQNLAEVQTGTTFSNPAQVNISRIFAKALWLTARQKGDVTARKKAFINAICKTSCQIPEVVGYIRPFIKFMNNIVENKCLWKLSDIDRKKLYSLKMLRLEDVPDKKLFPILNAELKFSDQIFDSKKYSDKFSKSWIFGDNSLRNDDFLISSTDNAMTSIVTVVWCIVTTNSLSDAIIRAANLGQYSDAVAAIVGQVAGAIYGASAIPIKDVSILAHKEWLYSLSLELMKLGGFIPLE